jgi:hypothetical protein
LGPEDSAPPVIDLLAKTCGAKRNTVALRKKNRPRMDGRDALGKAIRRPQMANRCGGQPHMHELYVYDMVQKYETFSKIYFVFRTSEWEKKAIHVV